MLEFHRCYAGAGVSLPRLELLFQSCRLAARRHNTALKLTYNKDIKAIFKAQICVVLIVIVRVQIG